VPRCSFCGRTEPDVLKILVRPEASICDECAALFREFVDPDEADQDTGTGPRDSSAKIRRT
jgi:ATP-dependent protease Clp ATPase subunit